MALRHTARAATHLPDLRWQNQTSPTTQEHPSRTAVALLTWGRSLVAHSQVPPAGLRRSPGGLPGAETDLQAFEVDVQVVELVEPIDATTPESSDSICFPEIVVRQGGVCAAVSA